jgi:hypothetical protein
MEARLILVSDRHKPVVHEMERGLKRTRDDPPQSQGRAGHADPHFRKSGAGQIARPFCRLRKNRSFHKPNRFNHTIHHNGVIVAQKQNGGMGSSPDMRSGALGGEKAAYVIPLENCPESLYFYYCIPI